MVKQFIKKGPITKTDYWFAKKIKPSFLSSYFQSSFDGKIFGMKRKENYTIHINLKDDLEVIKGKFDKGTAYEVRRAEKDGITMEIVHDKTEFVDFYNSFAKAKGLEGTSLEYNIFDKEIIMTKAVLDSETLVMHSYIVDEERARLYMSCSQYLTTLDKQKRALLGRGNRYLHYKDIEIFKKKKLLIYDLGGYAKDTTDKYLIGINKFKMGLGGTIVKEYHHTPFWR